MTTERVSREPMTSFDSDAANVADGMAESQADLIASRPAASKEPEGTAAVFNRMGLTVDLEEDVDTTEEACHDGVPTPVLSQRPDRSQMAEHASDATGEDAEDAMVAEYMQRLLGRMRGDESPTISDATRKSRPTGAAAAERSSTANSLTANSSADRNSVTTSTSTTTPSNGASNTVHERAVRQPRKPRPATVPESSCDWTAMRELANLSARGALDMHSRQRLTRDTFTKLLLVGLSLAAGISMALNASVVGMYAWVGAGVCWTITVVWGAQYLCLFRLCYGYGRRGKKRQSSGGDLNDPKPVAADSAAHTGTGD